MMIIFRGPVASGKSTEARRLAKEYGYIRVSRDDIRYSLFGVYYGCDENLVTKFQDALIRTALAQGKSVIVDDTNIEQKYIDRFVAIAHEYGVSAFTYTRNATLEESLANNKTRGDAGGNMVPEHAVRRIHKRFEETPEPVINSSGTFRHQRHVGLPDAILCDLDGTLAHNLGTRGWFDWLRVGEDVLDSNVATMLDSLAATHRIIILSGRDSVCRDITIDWLNRNNVIFDQLLMRAEKDQREDSVVKQELFERHIEQAYNVTGVFDDRPRVCRMWSSIGVKVFQVGDPYFEF